MCLHEKQKCARQAFTLVELTAVVGITAILASLLLLGVSAARESARKVQCSNNLKQIGLGLLAYESSHKVLPRASLPNRSGPLIAILPYVEYSSLYDSIDFSVPMERIHTVNATQVKLYRCPSTLAQSTIRTDYGLNRGVTLAPEQRRSPWFAEEQKFPKLVDFSRGTHATPLLAEICPNEKGTTPGKILDFGRHDVSTVESSQRYASLCHDAESNAFGHHRYNNGEIWYGAGYANYYHMLPPLSNSCGNEAGVQHSLFSAVSMHTNGCYLVFADGHVDFLTNSIDREVWHVLGSR